MVKGKGMFMQDEGVCHSIEHATMGQGGSGRNLTLSLAPICRTYHFSYWHSTEVSAIRLLFAFHWCLSVAPVISLVPVSGTSEM